MNDMEKKQQETLKAALAAGPRTGELSDEELECVAGGEVLTGPFFVAICNLCGWRAAFDKKGEFDIENIALDHIRRHPNCPGDFTIYGF